MERVKLSSITEVIDHFAIIQDLAINTGNATQGELSDLSEILTEMTNARPYNTMSFYSYMCHAQRDFPYMVCDDGSVSSWGISNIPDKTCYMTVDDVLAVRDVVSSVSKEDFDAVFDT